MKVINNKTKKQYTIDKETWESLKASGKSVRFTVVPEVQAFKPKELKIDIKKDTEKDSKI